MTNKDPSDPGVIPLRSPEPRRQPARPDPETGEVPAGPGDAGLQDSPRLNAGSSGTKQLSNRRLGIGIAIAAGLTVLVAVVAALL